MNSLRSEIKHNFLRQIIFRLDYEGILEADIEKCVFNLRQKFFDAGFGNMETRAENQFDIQVKMDLNLPNENQFAISNTNQSLVYRFLSEDKETIEIGKSFFTFTVNIEKEYKTFDNYIGMLADTIEEIKNSSPFFRVLRIGLRKINICYLSDLNHLSRHFTRSAFNLNDVIEQFSEYGCSASNMVTILSKDGYQVNYVRNIQEGVMQQEDGSQKTTYQIALDIDVYRESNREIMPMLSGKDSIMDTINMQNCIEFEVFIKSLSDELIQCLKENEFKSEIGGVN